MTLCFSFSFACSLSPFKCQIEVVSRGLLSLLDEAVKQHHTPLFYAKKNPCNAAARQAAPDFPQIAPPSEPTSGMPIGHENSTSLMSPPITFRSSASSPVSHSRTGSRPLSER